MFVVSTYDDEEKTAAIEIEDEAEAWGIYCVLAAMYMKSTKRDHDAAKVELIWNGNESKLIASYEQVAYQSEELK